MSIEGTAQTEYASLSGKIHTIVVDKTLSISGACADAKATGDEVEKLYDISDDAKKAYEDAKAAYDEAISGMQEAARVVAQDVAKEEVSKLEAADVGAYSKEESISAATKSLFGLGTDAVPDDVFQILSKIGAEVHIIADIGTTVTMSRNGKTLTAIVESDGYAVFYPTEFGEWTINFTYDGIQKEKGLTLIRDSGVVTVEPFVVGNSLEETSWYELSIMSKYGVCDQYFKVGDKKNITVNGVSYPVQIIGFNHDTLTSGGIAGMTFQLVNCLNTTYKMESSATNANGWEGCLMRKTTLSTIYNQLNSDLKAVIKAVNKVSSVGNQSSSLETTSDKLFLLSEIEIFGSTTYSFAGEGKQYKYYAAGNSRVKTVNGSASKYWERSPNKEATTGFCLINASGAYQREAANISYGVSFAFCV